MGGNSLIRTVAGIIAVVALCGLAMFVVDKRMRDARREAIAEATTPPPCEPVEACGNAVHAAQTGPADGTVKVHFKNGGDQVFASITYGSAELPVCTTEGAEVLRACAGDVLDPDVPRSSNACIHAIAAYAVATSRRRMPSGASGIAYWSTLMGSNGRDWPAIEVRQKPWPALEANPKP